MSVISGEVDINIHDQTESQQQSKDQTEALNFDDNIKCWLTYIAI